MAKARMKPDVSLYAEAKYQDPGYAVGGPQKALYRLLYQRVYMPREMGGTGIAKKYDLPASIIEGLCKVSLSEDLGHNRCSVCLGKGEAYVPNRVECNSCGGSGRVKVTARKIAGELGCTERHYRGRWRDPHDDVKAVLHDWDRKVWRTLRALLSEGDWFSQEPASAESVWDQQVSHMLYPPHSGEVDASGCWRTMPKPAQ